MQSPLAILFLPFILFEGFIGGIAQSLNIAPPPQFFTQLSSGQGLLPPPPQEFIKGMETSYSNEETWEWEDWRGRNRSITVHRHARES